MTGTPLTRSLARLLIILLLAVTGFFAPLPQTGSLGTALIGVAAALVLLAAESRVRAAKLPALLGATAGLLASATLACLASIILHQSAPAWASFASLALWFLLSYLGVAVGAAKGVHYGATEIHRGDAIPKLLDTSVLIDGRIADIVEAGFLDGPLLVPEFVLHELQGIADSPDTMRRNRGRRGLDILQRIRQVPGLPVEFSKQDFPQIREVDLKLVEFAKQSAAKLVTNDFNLQKVAQVQGVSVLNINELASLLKPVVLPGETMRVFVFKEGKEHNQGVGYLDDGTMVVVDNARRMISKTIDISVTSVLQTTAGKMIFGKFDERQHGHTVRNGPDSRVNPPDSASA